MINSAAQNALSRSAQITLGQYQKFQTGTKGSVNHATMSSGALQPDYNQNGGPLY